MHCVWNKKTATIAKFKIKLDRKFNSNFLIMKPQMVEQKLISSTSGEADECLFDYLHAELVNYVLTKNIDSKVSALK